MSYQCAEAWREIFERNGLATFDSLWDLRAGWFEAPNRDRGGWSGVSRLTLRRPDGEQVGVFLKRQEGHVRKSLLHPLQGAPTARLELDNIMFLGKSGVPTLDVALYAERRQHGRFQTMLATAELAGYQSLDQLLEQWRQDGMPPVHVRRSLARVLGIVVGRMHQLRFQHRCLYPKHLFVRLPDSPADGEDPIDIRVIDLEKGRRWLLGHSAATRDLESLHRRTSTVSYTDRLAFLHAYFETSRLRPWHRRLVRRTIGRTEKRRDQVI